MRFSYKVMRVRDMIPITVRDKSAKSTYCTAVEVEGERINTSDRFWRSLCHRFGFNSRIFRLFNHDEVFARIAERASDDSIRLTVEHDNGKSKLLAVSNPTSQIVQYDQLQDIMTRRGVATTYSSGVVRTAHTPRIGSEAINIGPDAFRNQFVVDFPIDGWGQPSIYVGLLRIVCTNGAVGYNKAFRSTINLGTKSGDTSFTIERMIDNFNNEGGFLGIRQRFESAMQSWASIREARRLRSVINTLHARNYIKGAYGATRSQTMEDGRLRFIPSPCELAYDDMVGDMAEYYGISSYDSLSAKRMRILPCKARVIDLVNFASELATHHCVPEGNRLLQAWIGETIGNEYDLEGTALKFSDFEHFKLARMQQKLEMSNKPAASSETQQSEAVAI